MNQAETCAAQDARTAEVVSKVRQVNLTLFDWPDAQGSARIAVLQYEFKGASPPGACTSIGLLARLENVPNQWIVKERYLFDTVHHEAIPSSEMLDLTGDGIDDLVVESDWAGGGTAATEVKVFDLRRGHLSEILAQYCWFRDLDEEYTQKLDLPRTLASRGARFCFAKSVTFENGRRLAQPKSSTPCYATGDIVDAEAKERNEMLKPLHAPAP
jgi:hypothetical protein